MSMVKQFRYQLTRSRCVILRNWKPCRVRSYRPAGFPTESRDSSRVIEIDPITKNIVWSYDANDSGERLLTFFSPFISGMHRLPNGNTLIDEGAFGRFFEVTPEGEIVWEYVNPFFTTMSGSDIETNRVYRVWRVPLDWPQF